MSHLKYWVWLSTRRGLAGVTMQRVLDHFGGPERVYYAHARDVDELTELSCLARSSLKDKSMREVERILDHCDQLGIRVMTRQDAVYPQRLENIPQPPLVLYAKGRPISLDDQVAIAMVGTRSCTPYGERVAGKLAMELTHGGAMVVSGMAQGIDAASIRGALMAGGTVVSVLAGGLDVIYPRYHRFLYEDVAASGLLLSEYPLGTEHKGSHFPVRNRIISGLSLGVVVVESPRRGGALITASHALDQNRDVYAVPGAIDAPASEGTNRLIQEGAAKLVTCGEDVLCEWRDRFPEKLGVQPPLNPQVVEQRLQQLEQAQPAPVSPKTAPAVEKKVDNPESMEYIDWKECRKNLTDDEQVVLLALQEGAKGADGLVEHTQRSARQVLAALTMLQLQGYVAQGKDKRFRAAVKLKME